jgi:hypothetical protein
VAYLAPIDTVAIGFWIGLVAVQLGIFLLFFSKYLKSQDKNNIKLAICLVYLFLAIGGSLFIFYDYYFTQLEPSLYETYQSFWKIAFVFQLAGFGFLFLVSENRVFHGKDYYIFFLGFLGFSVAAIVVNDFVLTQNLMNFSFLFAAFIPISYIYLASKLSGATRSNILLILYGIIIFIIGMALNLLDVVIAIEQLTGNTDAIHYLYLLTPILQTVGLIVAAKGFNGLYF